MTCDRLPLFRLALAGVLVAIAAPGFAADATFSKDISPILQKSCQSCHRPGT